jgi:hypothetical protein
VSGPPSVKECIEAGGEASVPRFPAARVALGERPNHVVPYVRFDQPRGASPRFESLMLNAAKRLGRGRLACKSKTADGFLASLPSRRLFVSFVCPSRVEGEYVEAKNRSTSLSASRQKVSRRAAPRYRAPQTGACACAAIAIHRRRILWRKACHATSKMWCCLRFAASSRKPMWA